MAATTFNPSDSLDCTFSNANLTASFQTTVAFRTARSTNPKTSGKWHIEFTADASSGSGTGLLFGIATNLAALNNYISSDNDGAAIYPHAGSANFDLRFHSSSGMNYPTTGNCADGDIWAFEVDIDNLLFWGYRVTNPTGWTDGVGGFTGNPGAGTGGTFMEGMTTAGGVMIAACGTFIGSPDTTTMNPGPTFALTPSSGFSPWDAPASDTLMGVSLLSL